MLTFRKQRNESKTPRLWFQYMNIVECFFMNAELSASSSNMRYAPMFYYISIYLYPQVSVFVSAKYAQTSQS